MNDLLFESPIAISFDSLLDKGLGSVGPEILEALRKDNFSLATKLANQAYAKHGPRDLNATLTYAILLSHRHLGEEALGVLKKALEFHSAAASIQLAQADALIAREDFEAAEALLLGLAQISFPNPRHLAYLGDLFMELDLADQALKVYQRALDADFLDAGVAISVANIHRDQDRDAAAAEAFELAGRIAPNDPYVWAHAGDSWMVVQDYERAATAYRRASSLEPGFGHAWTHLGMALLEIGDPKGALRGFKKAQKLNPDDPEMWINIGHTLLEMGQPDEARQAYERVLREDPLNLDAMHGLTAAAFELGDVELAERMANQSVEGDPDNPDAHYNLGIILLSLNRNQAALAEFEFALGVDPDEPRYCFSAASAHAQLGDLVEAIEIAKQGCALLQDDATSAFEFVRDSLSLFETQPMLELLEIVEVHDERWDAIKPLFEFLMHALRRSDQGQAERVDAFVQAVKRSPEMIPVFWDFDELERLILGLQGEQADMVDTMISVLEGRKELDAIKGTK